MQMWRDSPLRMMRKRRRKKNMDPDFPLEVLKP